MYDDAETYSESVDSALQLKLLKAMSVIVTKAPDGYLLIQAKTKMS